MITFSAVDCFSKSQLSIISSNTCITGGWWHLDWGGRAHDNGWSGMVNTWFDAIIMSCPSPQQPPLTCTSTWYEEILNHENIFYVKMHISTGKLQGHSIILTGLLLVICISTDIFTLKAGLTPN
jgi:hypothetical protein